MSDYIYLLVTLLYNGGLMRCALQVKSNLLPYEFRDYPMEPENLQALYPLLPPHVSSLGPIVEVDFLFNIHIAPDSAELNAEAGDG